MWLIVFAFLATIIGPPLYGLAARNDALKKTTDSFILVLTAGIIIFQVLPETFSELGVWSIVLTLIGTGLPGLIEYLFRRAANKTHVLTLSLAILGLMLHGVMDGSVLTFGNINQNGELLPIAILLHRVPISLTLWWLVKPEFGARTAAMVIVMLLLGTLLGYLYAEQLMSSLHQPSFMAFQALVSGALLHVLYHRPGHNHRDHSHHTSHDEHKKTIKWDKSFIIGTSLALIVLVLLLHIHEITG